MSIHNCTSICAVVHPLLTNLIVPSLCEICAIFHWAGQCPDPCASESPCSLKLFSIDPWPCDRCFEATQNKLASGPWILPAPTPRGPSTLYFFYFFCVFLTQFRYAEPLTDIMPFLILITEMQMAVLRREGHFMQIK